VRKARLVLVFVRFDIAACLMAIAAIIYALR
jgi:hypothetical protein